MSGWFPHLSPSGRRVASGHDVIEVDGVSIGRGIGPQWADETTLYFVRQPDGAFVRWRAGEASIVVHEGAPPSMAAALVPLTWRYTDRGLVWAMSAAAVQPRAVQVVRTQGFNQFAVSPSGWAGVRTDPPRVEFSDGRQRLGHSGVALSAAGEAASLEHASGQLVDDHGVIDPRPCRDARYARAGEALCWNAHDGRRWRIAGRRTRNAPVEDISVENEEFWPIPIPTSAGLFVLRHGHTRLLLVPWGARHGYVVAEGVTDFPHATPLHDGLPRVRVVWSARGILHERTIDLSAPHVDLDAPPPRPSPSSPPPPSPMGLDIIVDPQYPTDVSVGDTVNVAFHLVSDAAVTDLELDIEGDGLPGVALHGDDLRAIGALRIQISRPGTFRWLIRAKTATGLTAATGRPRTFTARPR